MCERRELHAFLASFISFVLMCPIRTRGGTAAPSVRNAASYGGQHSPTTKENKKAEVQFKMLLTGEIEDEDKVHLGITNFLASDGVGVTLIQGQFPSATAAQEYLEKVLGRAVSVTARSEKKDQAGNVVGKRARAIVHADKPDKPIPAILFTYGKDFYEIQSDSYRHSCMMETRITSSN